MCGLARKPWLHYLFSLKIKLDIHSQEGRTTTKYRTAVRTQSYCHHLSLFTETVSIH